MKRLMLALTLVLMLAGISPANAHFLALPPDVQQQGSIWIITPHNLSPDDPDRIQQVVDMAAPGDTIRLAAGTFDFGDFESVHVDKNLIIQGAWDMKADAPLTTIKGGFIPLAIGRKTPFWRPEQVMIDGHAVYHVTPELYGRTVAPFSYPPYTGAGHPTYDMFANWVQVNVTLRQLRFERPYFAALWPGAIEGGVMERIQIDTIWPPDASWENLDPKGSGIIWWDPAGQVRAEGMRGRPWDKQIYYRPSLIVGDVSVRDLRLRSHARSMFGVDQADEAGDVVLTLYDPSNPAPPGDYDKYVLQDVPFAWDAANLPLTGSSWTYWVKKGYAAYYYWWYDGQVRATRAMSAGIYSGGAQMHLTVEDSSFHDCLTCVFLFGNGFEGTPFTVVLKDSEIVTNADPHLVSSATGFLAWSGPVYDSYYGEWLDTEPGTNVEVRDNHFVTFGRVQDWGYGAIDVETNGSALVEGNDVETASSFGIGLWYPTEGGSVLNNRVSGAGNWALVTFWDANGNEFRGNNINGFTPNGPGLSWADPVIPAAEVLLLSNNNMVIGGGDHEPGVTVLDYGMNNVVTGMTRQLGRQLNAAGQDAVQAAIRRKQGLMK